MMSNYDWDPGMPEEWVRRGTWVEEEGDVSSIQVDEEYWGEGAEVIIHDWLRHNYDFQTMPALQVTEVRGKEGLWLLGWAQNGTSWPSLLPLIFGNEYADRQLAYIKQKGISMKILTEGQYGVGMRQP